MPISVTTKFRVGFSIALLGAIAIFGGLACLNSVSIRRNVPAFAIVTALAGGLALFKGQISKVKVVDPPNGEHLPQQKPTHANPFAFLKSSSYWGFIVLVSGVVLYAFKGSNVHAPVPVVVARPLVIAVTPVVFPALDLQALVINGSKSTAMINGQVVCVGEGIGNVKVIAIDDDHVEVELGGQTKLLRLEQ